MSFKELISLLEFQLQKIGLQACDLFKFIPVGYGCFTGQSQLFTNSGNIIVSPTLTPFNIQAFPTYFILAPGMWQVNFSLFATPTVLGQVSIGIIAGTTVQSTTTYLWDTFPQLTQLLVGNTTIISTVPIRTQFIVTLSSDLNLTLSQITLSFIQTGITLDTVRKTALC